MKMSSISTTVKPNEVKREEFRKYLEHHGVMDALTTVLVSLYEENERPDDALEYIRKHFAVNDVLKPDSTLEVESLKRDLAEAKSQIAELQEKLNKKESENAA
ncbi:c-Myc-binding protein homolog [Nasonia vitripennis]|uniref:c-Myc-binding protein n=1 Tax=Nasonia vitripennis TaxID=7425 RepID=A0A7M7HD88_NASVI|nr:c-Myc-binding protein homolog [Nasonia vitripennis]